MNIVGKKLNKKEFKEYISNKFFGFLPANRLVLHHTFIPNEEDWRGERTFQGMKTYYENKGWSTGPHIYIAPDGIWLFTDMRKNGTHAGRKGNNRSIGIEMVGDFQSNAPKGVVWETTMFVITALNKKLNLLTENIKFHRDFTATDCPGKATKKEWVIKQLKDYISLPDNALVKGETKKAVYFVKKNIKYPIPDWETFLFFWENKQLDIKIISDEKLEQTKKGKVLPSIKNLI